MSTLKLVVDQGLLIKHGPERDTEARVTAQEVTAFYYGIPGNVAGAEVYLPQHSTQHTAQEFDVYE